MQESMKSEGKCLFCGEIFTKVGINKHLFAHLKEIGKSGQSGQSFLLKVEPLKRRSETPYFLSLWVDGETTLKTIDTFLRDIWLECCGHLSAFTLPGQKTANKFNLKGIYNSFLVDNDSEYSDEISMRKKTKVVFSKGLKLEYTYDFGSSTQLNITVISEIPVKADKKIVLLSRNEPLEILCSVCKKAPATQICTMCCYDEDAEFCEKCAKKHEKMCNDFADYAAMPVVNSPRMGICGYKGGSIDTERDI